MYLGDGYVARLRRTWALRIYMDATQVQITERVRAAMESVNPFHKASTHTRDRDGVTIVTSSGACWLKLIPQHGPGHKHERHIELVDWQRDIVMRHAPAFVRGLIESDGCRFDRVVNGKAYPAYEFTNRSSDIIGLFCWACDLLGIHYTRPSAVDVSIARRADVAALDLFIGPKS